MCTKYSQGPKVFPQHQERTCIFIGYLVKFQLLIFYIQQYEILGNFEKVTFPLTSMVTLHKNC